MSDMQAFAGFPREEDWQARALKAEEECRLLGIAQFEANAARLKAEEALREEREACARLADDEPIPGPDMPVEAESISRVALVNAAVIATKKGIAAAIRARAALDKQEGK